jgi:nucleoside 2-deoxyribosyltransferase
MKVYLSGGFYKNYKIKITEDLGEVGITVIDPELKTEVHHIPGYYVGWDLEAIRQCDLILAYLDDYPYVYGMAAEVGYATALNIPVIFVCCATRVDSFLSGLARATFTNFVAATSFIIERYGEKKNEESELRPLTMDSKLFTQVDLAKGVEGL